MRERRVFDPDDLTPGERDRIWDEESDRRWAAEERERSRQRARFWGEDDTDAADHAFDQYRLDRPTTAREPQLPRRSVDVQAIRAADREHAVRVLDNVRKFRAYLREHAVELLALEEEEERRELRATTVRIGPDSHGWNKVLAQEGHPVLRPPKVPDRELDRRMRVGSEGALAEAASLKDEMGIAGFSYTYGPTGHPDRSGRRKSKTKAVKLTTGDSTRYLNVKNDSAAIRELLTRHRQLTDYRAAIARGRRTTEASALRAELAAQVMEAIEAGANRQAVAEVLGCDRKVVGALVREARPNRTL